MAAWSLASINKVFLVCTTVSITALYSRYFKTCLKQHSKVLHLAKFHPIMLARYIIRIMVLLKKNTGSNWGGTLNLSVF